MLKIVKESASKEHLDEVERISAQLRAIPREKKPPSTDQCPSTTAILKRDPSLDGVTQQQLNDLSYWGQLKYKAEVPRENWNIRDITPDEYALIDNVRRKPKNSIGQSEKSAVTDDKKEFARQVYMSTPGKTYTELSEPEKQKIVQITKPELPKEIKEEWKPLTTWQAFKHWLKGGKVRLDEKK